MFYLPLRFALISLEYCNLAYFFLPPRSFKGQRKKTKKSECCANKCKIILRKVDRENIPDRAGGGREEEGKEEEGEEDAH